MISILDRYILKQVTGIFLFGIGLFTVMLEAQNLFVLVRFALEQHLGTGVMLRLVVLRLPYFLVLSFPMALLLGALLAVGRLADHNEVVAMRTGGISLARMAVPVLAAGALVAAASLALSEYVVPLADQRYWDEVRRVTGQAPPARGYLLFREEEGAGISVYYARRVSEDGATLEGVVVNQEEAGRLARVIVADRARFLEGQWIFQDGIVHDLSGPQRLEVRFKHLVAGIRRTPREILAERKEPADMSIRELLGYINVLRRTGESVARYLVWLHSRIALPISSITFALLALPLGLRPHRSSSSIGMGLTVLIVLVYYLLFTVFMALGETGRLPAALAAWLPNLFVAGVGGVLLWRVR